MEHEIANLEKSINTEAREFLGYLLVSQMNTIESVGRLETDMNQSKEKTSALEKGVSYLVNKCMLLEETINHLKNLFISRSDEYLDDRGLKVFRGKNMQETGLLSPSSTPERNRPATKPLSSLIEVCSDLYKLEGLDEREFKEETSSAADNAPVKPREKPMCSSPPKEISSLRRRLCLEQTAEKRAQLSDEEKKEIQRLFNKRIKYEVNRKFGKNYLIKHQVRELDVKKMHRIKKKVLRIFSPFPLPIKVAWSNAMNSLRQDRHQLKKKRAFK